MSSHQKKSQTKNKNRIKWRNECNDFTQDPAKDPVLWPFDPSEALTPIRWAKTLHMPQLYFLSKPLSAARCGLTSTCAITPLGIISGQLPCHCHPPGTCFADPDLPWCKGALILTHRVLWWSFNATVDRLGAAGWSLSSSGKYVYSRRVKTPRRSRPTNQSIWLYHVLLNERFTHTDH